MKFSRQDVGDAQIVDSRKYEICVSFNRTLLVICILLGPLDYASFLSIATHYLLWHIRSDWKSTIS